MANCIRSDLESDGSALPAAGSACGAFSRSGVSPPYKPPGAALLGLLPLVDCLLGL